MAVTKKTGDRFANVAALYSLTSATDTFTSVKFAFPFSIQDKTGLVINRIEYWPSALGQLNSSMDYLWMGILASNSIVDPLNQADPVLVDSMRFLRLDYGTAASGMLVETPYVKDLSTLPGGGILVAPSPLYMGVTSLGSTGACGGWVKFYYTYLSLTTEEYWELVESRRIISS